jgi:hypothetical protein
MNIVQGRNLILISQVLVNISKGHLDLYFKITCNRSTPIQESTEPSPRFTLLLQIKCLLPINHSLFLVQVRFKLRSKQSNGPQEFIPLWIMCYSAALISITFRKSVKVKPSFSPLNAVHIVPYLMKLLPNQLFYYFKII